MDTFVEIEAKYLLSEEDFKRLFETFKNSKMKYKVQINYYFDMLDNTLLNNKIMFRVRSYVDYYEATLKLPQENGAKLEINETVSQEEFINLCAGRGIYEGVIQQKLKELGYNVFDLELVGNLETRRYSLAYEGGELFFDENYYNDKVDYEIEYEVSSNLDEANRIVLELFEKNNIKSYTKAEGKRNRATKKGV